MRGYGEAEEVPMFAVDLDRFRATPLIREPFSYVIVPQFITPAAHAALERDFPRITQPGSFPASALTCGRAFRRMVDELTGAEVCAAFGEKFGLELGTLPTVVTVRGQSGPKDGSIHTDLPGKVITVLIYLNRTWNHDGGCLRLLCSDRNLDDVIAEVPPVNGTLLAFRRSDNSWHGHKPFLGERRVLQLNWVTPQHRRALRRQEIKEAFAGFMRRMFMSRSRAAGVSTKR
jgi:hypothetical protein